MQARDRDRTQPHKEVPECHTRHAIHAGGSPSPSSRPSRSASRPCPPWAPSPGAHAAAARPLAHGHGAKATHAKPLRTQARIKANYIIPGTVPSGATVVTNCTSAGPNDLYAALQTSATITFACTGTGPYTINLGDTFEVAAGEALTIDGSDGGRNDVAITGGATIFSTGTCPKTDPSGGGHQIFYVDSGSALTLNNLTLTDGYAYIDDASGGAVEAFGTFTASRDTFSYNGADDYGGALELATDSSTSPQVSTITNSTFDHNYTSCDTGGAIDVDSEGSSGPQQVTLANDTLTNNTAYDDDGGALYADNDNATSLVSVAASVFRNNQALNDDEGGAITFYEGNATVASTLFAGNYATDEGGAIYNDTSSSFLTTVTDSTFVQNRADSYGGAITSYDPLRITNSTFTRNSAGEYASAIYSDDPLTIAASTINANTTDTSTYDYNGAALVNTGSTADFSVGTSIVYGNVAGFTATPSECGGSAVPLLTDLGHNLSDYDVPGIPATNSCGFTQPPDILVPVGTSIGLGPLGAYGGPALGAPGHTSPTYTERLLPGSPALDKVPSGPTGACVDAGGMQLTTDERGFVRPFPAGGNCDTGAFEASVLTFGGPFVGPFGTSGSCSVAITFFSGGTAFALRTGDSLRTLMSYLSIKGPGGTITAVPLVPRAGVPSTLTCTTPDPAASLTVPPASATTVTVDAQVVASSNPSIARLGTVRVVATRTATSETVTVSAINPDNTTGATLYSLTPSVQPQSFAVGLGTFPLYPFF